MSNYQPQMIANMFIELAKENGSRHFTQLDLQKLCYIAHGTYLALTDEPLIGTVFEAWDYGPVSPELYHELKLHGNKPIKELMGGTFIEDEAEIREYMNRIKSNPSAKNAIDIVYKNFKNVSSAGLVAFTHKKGTPWENHYQPDTRNIELPDTETKEYFKKFKKAQGKLKASAKQGG